MLESYPPPPLLQFCMLHGAPQLPSTFAAGRGAKATDAWAQLQRSAVERPHWSRQLHGRWLPDFRAAVRALLLANHRGFPRTEDGSCCAAGPASSHADCGPIHLDLAVVELIIRQASADTQVWRESWSGAVGFY